MALTDKQGNRIMANGAGKRVLDFAMKQTPGSTLTTKEIEEGSGASHTSASTMMRRLVEAGVYVVAARGLWLRSDRRPSRQVTTRGVPNQRAIKGTPSQREQMVKVLERAVADAGAFQLFTPENMLGNGEVNAIVGHLVDLKNRRNVVSAGLSSLAERGILRRIKLGVYTKATHNHAPNQQGQAWSVSSGGINAPVSTHSRSMVEVVDIEGQFVCVFNEKMFKLVEV